MTPNTDDAPVENPPGTASVTVQILCWLALCFALIRFPGAMPSERIDPSWLAFLGYAFSKNLQAGVDYIFTYGPLGAFFGNIFVPDLFWQRYAWELSVRPLQALSIVWLLARVGSARVLVLATALLCWFFLLQIDAQAVWHLAILCSLLVLEGALGLGLTVMLPMAAFLAIASLVKFSFFYQAVIGLGVILLCGREPSPIRRLRVCASFLCFFALVWLLSGQQVASLPPYLVNSFAVARAYSDAMTIPGSPLLLALALLALTASLSLIVATGLRRGRADRAPGELLLLLVSCFLAFKHGVVRQDAHLSSTFAVLMFTPFLLRRHPLAIPRASALRVLGALAFGISVLGLALTNAEHRRGVGRLFDLHASARWRTLTSPAAEEARLLERWQQQKRKLDLSEARARIGDHSVDVFAHSQGSLLLNDFNLVTRPVFQSHMAYSPKLLRANAEFYRSSAAPEFVLLALQTIDGRLPTLEDSLALRVIRERYQVVSSAGPYLVLERRTLAESPPAAADVVEFRRRGRIAFGEWVACDTPLCNQDWGLSLRIRKSFLGELRSLLFRGERVFLELDVGGPSPARYRLIPGMAEAPFLVSPSPVNVSPTRLLLPERATATLRPRRFRVVSGGSEIWFEQEIEFGIVDDDVLRPLTVAPRRAERIDPP